MPRLVVSEATLRASSSNSEADAVTVEEKYTHDLVIVLQPAPVSVYRNILGEQTDNLLLAEIRRCFVPEDSDAAEWRIAVLAGDNECIQAHLKAYRPKCMVWCSVGFDVCPSEGSPCLFTQFCESTYRPPITILCFKYGVRRASSQFYDTKLRPDDTVVWFAMDVTDCTTFGASSFEHLLAFVRNVMTEGGMAKRALMDLQTQTELLVGCFPEDCFSSVQFEKGSFRVEMRVVPPRVTNLLSSTTTILHLQSRDLDMVRRVQRRVLSEKLWLEPTNNVERERCRAVAMQVCQHYIQAQNFESVFHINSKRHVEDMLKSSKEKMLIWLDTEDDEVVQAVQSILAHDHVATLVVAGMRKEGSVLESLLDEWQFEPLACCSGGSDVRCSDLHEEIRICASTRANVLEGLDVEQFKSVVNRLISEIAGDRQEDSQNLLGLYQDDSGSVLVQICMKDVGYLHKLCDWVLQGNFEKHLNGRLQVDEAERLLVDRTHLSLIHI